MHKLKGVPSSAARAPAGGSRGSGEGASGRVSFCLQKGKVLGEAMKYACGYMPVATALWRSCQLRLQVVQIIKIEYMLVHLGTSSSPRVS